MKNDILEMLCKYKFVIDSKFMLENKQHGTTPIWELVFYTDEGERMVYLEFTLDDVRGIDIRFDTVSAFLEIEVAEEIQDGN